MAHSVVNTMFFMADDYNRMIEAAGVLKNCRTQADVARLLEITENGDQILTNWKSRGIPRTRINEIAKKIGCNPYWLENGEGIMQMVFAKTQAEARVLIAMQQMEEYNMVEDVSTVVKISDSLAKQTTPKHNGTQ